MVAVFVRSWMYEFWGGYDSKFIFASDFFFFFFIRLRSLYILFIEIPKAENFKTKIQFYSTWTQIKFAFSASKYTSRMYKTSQYGRCINVRMQNNGECCSNKYNRGRFRFIKGIRIKWKINIRAKKYIFIFTYSHTNK